MNDDNMSLRMPASYVTTYGYSKLERVTVKVSESEYKDLIKKAAIQQVTAIDVETWGCHIELHEQHDGVGVHTDRWAEVVFQRKVDDTEEEHSEPQV